MHVWAQGLVRRCPVDATFLLFIDCKHCESEISIYGMLGCLIHKVNICAVLAHTRRQS